MHAILIICPTFYQEKVGKKKALLILTIKPK